MYVCMYVRELGKGLVVQQAIVGPSDNCFFFWASYNIPLVMDTVDLGFKRDLHCALTTL